MFMIHHQNLQTYVHHKMHKYTMQELNALELCIHKSIQSGQEHKITQTNKGSLHEDAYLLLLLVVWLETRVGTERN